MEKPKTVKLTSGDRAFYIGVNAFLVFIGVVIAVPIISTISTSLTANGAIVSTLDKFILMPWKWDASAYKALHYGFLELAQNYGFWCCHIIGSHGSNGLLYVCS